MPLDKSLVRHGAFTLIELLIVIAIILILIAIALPNFLEAQLRAKVTKVSGDLRTVALALEDYQSQWCRYPPTAGLEPTQFGLPKAVRHSLMQLTTPQSLLRTLPLDVLAPQGEIVLVDWHVPDPPDGPFLGRKWIGWDDIVEGYTFYYWSTESFLNTPGYEPIGEGYKRNALNYTLRSTGPERDYDFNSNPHPFFYRNQVGHWFYAPTNGTKSDGDLIWTKAHM